MLLPFLQINNKIYLSLDQILEISQTVGRPDDIPELIYGPLAQPTRSWEILQLLVI